MNGRVMAAGEQPGGRPSRQINIVLRNQEPQMLVKDEAAAVQAAKSITKHAHFQEIQGELEQLVGLENIKDLVFEIYAFLQIAQMRTEAGLLSGAHVYHMIFKGNPGTGKTTVARIVAKLFQKMGVLSKGHLIEVERADLVGEYMVTRRRKQEIWLRRHSVGYCSLMKLTVWPAGERRILARKLLIHL